MHCLKFGKLIIAGLLFSLLTMVLEGCNSNSQQDLESKKESIASPRELLEELRLSLVSQDQERFLRCFKASTSERACLQQVFRTVQATLQLQKTIRQTYGTNAWEEFQATAMKSNPRPKLVPKVVPTDKDWWDQIKIHEEPRKAEFYNPLSETTNTIAQIDGVWKIEGNSLFGGAVDLAELTKFLKNSSAASEVVNRQILKEKPALEEIGFLLFEKMSR